MALSAQKAVTTAGTAVVLGDQVVNGPVMIKALIANTNNIYIGNDGADDVAAAGAEWRGVSG